MITEVREERLIVTSDTHIGSFFFDARVGLIRLLDHARVEGYNVCINGAVRRPVSAPRSG